MEAVTIGGLICLVYGLIIEAAQLKHDLTRRKP